MEVVSKLAHSWAALPLRAWQPPHAQARVWHKECNEVGRGDREEGKALAGQLGRRLSTLQGLLGHCSEDSQTAALHSAPLEGPNPIQFPSFAPTSTTLAGRGSHSRGQGR